jgi:hypothetical protein
MCCSDEREGRYNGEKKVRTGLAILHVSPKTLHVRVMKELIPARSATEALYRGVLSTDRTHFDATVPFSKTNLAFLV